tara:strand:+ start:1926 stop:2354 length:429 start_codon:yes stop_codon:yes gene_type:complete
MIYTAETYHGVTFDQYQEQVINKYRVKALHSKPIGTPRIANLKPLKARINYGKWIVDCPWCKSAEFVFMDNPIFLCRNCWNNATTEYIKVSLPKNINAIEAVLEKREKFNWEAGRKVYMNRNWEPGETVAFLEKENKDNGIE